MAVDIDHKLHVISTTGDPVLDPPLTIRSIGGDITLDSNLIVLGTAEIGGVYWPTVNDLSDPATVGKVLFVDAGPSIGIKDLAWNDITGKPVLSSVAVSGSYTDLLDKPSGGGGATGIANLTDVDIAGVEDGNFLQYFGGTWYCTPLSVPPPTLTLGQLSDVDVASTDGDVLTYDAGYGQWTNQPPTRGRPGNLTYASTLTADWGGKDVLYLTLTGNCVLTNSNASDGQKMMLCVQQDATGGRTLSFTSETRFGTDIPSITLTTTPNKEDKIGLIYRAAMGTYDVVAFAKGY